MDKCDKCGDYRDGTHILKVNGKNLKVCNYCWCVSCYGEDMIYKPELIPSNPDGRDIYGGSPSESKKYQNRIKRK